MANEKMDSKKHQGKNSNKDNISTLNTIDIYRKEQNKKRKAMWITIGIIFIIIFCIIFLIWQINKPKYSKDHAFTQFYIPNTSNIKGDVNIEEFISISPDFAIGANKYGYAVFINPDKAFERLLKNYKKGIKLIKKEFKLGNLSKNNFTSYEIYGAQVTTGTDEEKKEARMISRILDIYENSFDINTIDKMMFH